MPRIVNNRICFNDHNVVLAPRIWETDRQLAMNLLFDMSEHLSEHGRAGAHRREIQDTKSQDWFQVELPTISLQPQYRNEYEERHENMYLPSKMLCMIGLNNGNFHKVIWLREADRKDGFKTLWLRAYQQGLRIGKAQRRVAEAQYEAAYQRAVERFNIANGQTITSFDPVI